MNRFTIISIAISLFWGSWMTVPQLRAQEHLMVLQQKHQIRVNNKGLAQKNNSPSFFSSTGIKILIGVSEAALFLTGSDAKIDEEYAREDHSFFFKLLKPVGRVGEVYDSRFTFPAMAGLSVVALGYSHLKGTVEPGETVKLMWQALIVSSLATLSLKTLVGRHRPYTNDGQYAFNGVSFKLNSRYMSFPSGHTSSIFAMMTVLAKQVKSRWVKTGAYTFAVSVGFQRMLHRKHWATDVIAGGVIGYLAGTWVISRRRKKHYRGISLRPYLNGERAGIAFNF